MECINHPGKQAAGTCTFCGKALCAECLNRFQPPACEACLISHNAGIARRFYIDIGVTATIFLVVFILAVVKNTAHWQGGIFLGVILACAYWGWQFISRFSVPVLFTSGFGLAVYFAIKILLAMCIGLFVTPWQIFRRVRDIRAVRKLKTSIAQGKV